MLKRSLCPLVLVGLAACGGEESSPADPGGTLMTQDIVVGTGAVAASGDTVSVHYIGTLTTGAQFDSSYSRNEPYTFVLGAGQVIAGFDQGVMGMRVGGKRRLVIPPSLGYGNQPNGPIPANSTLVFEVDLVSIAGK